MRCNGESEPPPSGSGRMKRRTIFKLLLFVFAGAIINVAVGWTYLILLWDLGGTRTSWQRCVAAPEILIVRRDESAMASLVMLERFAGQSAIELPDDQFAPAAWLNAPSWFDARNRSPEFESAMQPLGD